MWFNIEGYYYYVYILVIFTSKVYFLRLRRITINASLSSLWFKGKWKIRMHRFAMLSMFPRSVCLEWNKYDDIGYDRNL